MVDAPKDTIATTSKQEFSIIVREHKQACKQQQELKLA